MNNKWYMYFIKHKDTIFYITRQHNPLYAAAGGDLTANGERFQSNW
jgi:hypothetical protein